MEIVSTFPSRRVFQAIFALEAGGATLDYEALHARLEEEDQHLLAMAALGDDVDVSEEQFDAAMASVRRSEGEHRRGEFLREAIAWHGAGRIAAKEHVVEGLANAPAHLLLAMQDGNFGRPLVRV